MSETISPALLPLGLGDLLAPHARIEADAVGRMMSVLESHGYERVKPPLLEFEESLLRGAGATLATETFRFMDPISQRMIGVRADMTPQVARIAAARLSRAPRPLRLSYAGQVLRVRGNHLRPERQIGQVGAELIGADGVVADSEVIAVAAEALQAVGVTGLAVDLTMPTLVPAVCAALGVDPGPLRAALAQKDAAEVARLGGAAAPILGRLLAAAGPAARALADLGALDLPEAATAGLRVLADVVARLALVVPGLQVTVDPVENRGFEYHTGISFTFFTRALSAELGRGGRYQAGDDRPEPATGFTLYTDPIVQAMPAAPADRRIFVPAGDEARAAQLRSDGWVTVAGLAPVADVAAEGRRLRCSHALFNGAILDLSKTSTNL